MKTFTLKTNCDIKAVDVEQVYSILGCHFNSLAKGERSNLIKSGYVSLSPNEINNHAAKKRSIIKWAEKAKTKKTGSMLEVIELTGKLSKNVISSEFGNDETFEIVSKLADAAFLVWFYGNSDPQEIR